MKKLSMLALAFVALTLPGSTLSQTAPPTACDFGEVVLFATHGIHVNTGASVMGDVAVNSAGLGPFLDEGVELAVDRKATVTGNLFADSIDLDRDSTVNGNLLYNELFNDGAAVNGTATQGLTLPVFSRLPAFQPAVFNATAQDVTVGPDQTKTLAAGDYRNIRIDATGTVIFSGGTYNVLSIGTLATVGGQCSTPCRQILFSAPTELRIQGRFAAEKNSKIGPAPGATTGAAGIAIHVGGGNGGDGALLSLPRAVHIEQNSEVKANFYVPNGTFRLDRESTLDGAVIARDINIQRDVKVERFSAFSNRPPVANPQDVFTSGAGTITITLTATDFENDDITFEIVPNSGPTQGTLGAVVEAQPPFPGDPPGCNPANTPGCIPPDPPRTSATVTYTPTTSNNLQDSFVFKATDACGNSSEATITINPPGDGTNPPPLANVDAFDALIDVVKDTPTLVTLSAGAPASVASLAFTIATLPANGALSDGATSIESVPFSLSGNSVTFTPTAGFTGTTSFTFRARDASTVDVPCPTPTPICDTGTVTIVVADQAELAPDSNASTNLNTPVQVTLLANAGGSGTQGSGFAAQSFSARPSSSGSATTNVHAGGAPLPGATIAGNVSDAPPYDGFGDGRDNLPGPAPVLVAAGVDVNLGASPSGSVSDPAGDATNSTADDPANPDLVSASVSSDGTNLNLSVRFVAAGFSSATSRGSFVLDIDENPATGFPGIDAANNDSALMGVEFLVNIGANLGASADVLKFVSLPNNFTNVGSFPATVLSDGYDVSIPLSTFNNDDGRMKFKAETQSFLGTGFTGILDYAPDVGLAPGQSKTGIQGTARIQIEWDVSQLPGADEIESALVTLHTLKGTVDDLDTVFFAGSAEQNGLLDVSDYEALATPIPNVVMPVPAGPTGTEGTFQFDVSSALKSARSQGLNYFSIQGRVDGEDDLVGGGFRRGLQVRSTATGNLNAGKEPQLTVVTTTTPQPAVLTWTITATPQFGTLKTLGGASVSVGSVFTLQPTLVYTPNFNFSGNDSIGYRVNQGSIFDTAVVGIFVGLTDSCVEVGRDPGCAPGGGSLQGGGGWSAAPEQEAYQPDTLVGPRLAVRVEGAGSVSSNPIRRAGNRLLGIVCASQRCVTKFEEGSDVVLLARTEDAFTTFEGWSGDCSGADPVTVVTMSRDRECVAVFKTDKPRGKSRR